MKFEESGIKGSGGGKGKKKNIREGRVLGIDGGGIKAFDQSKNDLVNTTIKIKKSLIKIV